MHASVAVSRLQCDFSLSSALVQLPFRAINAELTYGASLPGPKSASVVDVRFGSLADMTLKSRWKADIVRRLWDVRFGSLADIVLFDGNAHAADILDQTGHHIARRNRPNALRCSGHNHVARI